MSDTPRPTALPFAPIPGVLDVSIHRGASSDPAAPPDLLIEVPHGATRTRDFTALAAELTSPLPPDLVDFFHVNTDVGAPELAEAVARRFVLRAPTRSAAVLRCRIPRTLVDCNRRLDATPGELREGRVTPGLMPWIVTADDQALLLRRYGAYVRAVDAAAERVMPAGALLLLHSYAPREVDVAVDEHIVDNLRTAYAAEDRWPLRPEVDVIGRGVDGADLAPEAVVAALRSEMASVGVTVADGQTYPLHPSTLAWGHVTRWPGRVLCVEVRRDLLAAPFDPFAEMHIDPDRVSRLASPLATAAGAWW